MSSANLTQAETAHRASAVNVHSYTVDVDVRDARDQASQTFRVTSTIELTTAKPDTWVDFIGEVDDVLVDGEAWPFHHDGARIQLTGLPAERCAVTVRGRGHYSRTGEGLHRFVDPADGETYLYTQYEPADARRVFPNFEQPDMRAPFTFSLTGPSDWWLGSNQPEASREEVEPGVVRVEFSPTPTLSTYITCLCAGPYHRVDDTWRGKIELALLCRQSMARYLDAEELFRLTKAGLDWFTEAFGEYPWGKYDQIFVPEYNLGAMENPGLVTFTESYLFRSPATPAQLQARANTLVHEMSHMWFGDLVVPRWWGDLWLKESFAEFMGSHVSVEACGFKEGWVNFASNRKVGAYLADSMPTTHPVVADIPDLEAAKTNFDRITYSKGASALTQLVHYVGLDAFLAGCRRYFAQHAFGAATLADFIAALDAEAARDLSGWVEAWLRTAGHDTLSAQTRVEDGVIAELLVRRDFEGAGDPEADRPHATTVGLYVLDGDRLVLDARHEVLVEGPETPVAEAVGGRAPDVVLVNDLDRTFARVSLDPHSRATLLDHIGSLKALARAVAWSALWADVRAGALPPADFVGAVLSSGERQTGVLASILQRALVALDRYSDGHEARWRDGCRANLMAAEPGSAEQMLWAKAYLSAASLAPEDVRWVLNGEVPGLDVSVDISWAAWESLATQGSATDVELDAALNADDTAAGRTAHLRAVHSRPDAEVKEEAWRRAHSVGGETNDAVGALLAGFNALGQEHLRQPFAERYFERLESVWRDQPIEIAMRLVSGGFPADGHEDGYRWLAEHPDAPATLRRLVTEATHESAVADRVRRGPDVGPATFS
ncbi:aminopeptidase N [Tessaracoccus flavus]|uniref:Aminopeptidase N n=1 Tax=Tessaracoccus flavus TaxID=1610493 RepID=A0A1Q2CC88_9ACTN|nr:aminopeptidase N [Tessaracoccus flavus]AQP43733.1 aminopeptidase N [Tessaracoccus flavus]